MWMGGPGLQCIITCPPGRVPRLRTLRLWLMQGSGRPPSPLAWASQRLPFSQTGFPTHARPQGPQPSPTPPPPLRETRRLTIFSFFFHLKLMRIRADKSAVGTINRPLLLDDDYFIHFK